MTKLVMLVPPIGIGPKDNFDFDSSRPARHCCLCGDSFQPAVARSPAYLTELAIQHQVAQELEEWRRVHNAKHSEKEHLEHIKSGRMMTPQAALRLIPLGIYPISDLVLDDEVEQAGREAPRAPLNEVPYFI